MCRNIRPLFNFEPPATRSEVEAAARQFVRKISGFAHPSGANVEAFEHAVGHVTEAAEELLGALVTKAPKRDRSVEAARARSKSAARFPRRPTT